MADPIASDPLLDHFRSIAPKVVADPSASGDDLLSHFQALAPSGQGEASGSVSPSAAPAMSYVFSAPARIPLEMGSEALKGAAGDVDLAGNMIRQATSPLLAPGAPASRLLLPGEVERTGQPAATGTSGIVDLLQSADLVNNPALAPQSSGERIAGAAAAGLGSAAPALAFGAPAIPSLLSGAAGGAAGETAHEAMPESTVAPVLSGALAGMGVGGLSGNPASIGKLANSIGSADTLEAGGRAVQDAARNWVGAMPGKVQAIWAPIDAAIPGSTPTSLTNYNSTLQSMLGQGGRFAGNMPTNPAMLKRLQKGLANVGTAATWDEASDIRTDLGKLKANPSLDPGADKQQIDALYGALTSDMERTANFAGQGPQFADANAQTHALYDMRRGVFSKLVKGDQPEANDPRPGDVASSLVTGGYKQGSDLSVLRDQIPGALDELTSAHLQTNPKVWARLSPEAKAALVPSEALRTAIDAAVPDVASALSPIAHTVQAELSGGLVGALGEATSGLTGIPALISEGAGRLIGAVLPSAWRGAKGIVTDPRKAIQPMLGGAAGSESVGP